MNKNKKLNKNKSSKNLLSLSAIIALGSIITPIFAGNFFDTYGYSNFTPGGKFKIKDSSGKVVGTAYSTPSFSFRFKAGSQNYEPVFRASPPSIQAGCNGLNIKGMFLSVINIERFSEMLKNSGASLAWGILVGMIYSLPGIAATFRNLNQWAKMLQQLMQNMCKSGIAIGQSIMKTFSFDKYKGKDFALIPSPQSVVKSLDNPKDGEKRLFGLKGLGFSFKTMAFNFSDSDEDLTPAEVVKGWFNALLKAFYIPSLDSYMLGSMISNFNSTQRKKVFEGITDSLTTSGNVVELKLICVNYQGMNADDCKIDNITPGSNSVAKKAGIIDFNFVQNAGDTPEDRYNFVMDLWHLGVLGNFGDDITINLGETYQVIDKINTQYKNAIGSISLSDEKKQRLSSFLFDLENGKFGAAQVNIEKTKSGTIDLSNLAKEMTDLFYAGSSNMSPNNSFLKKMKTLGFIILKLSNPDNNDEKLYYLLYTGVIKNKDFVDVDALYSDFQEGAYQRTKKLINDMITKGVQTVLNSPTSDIYLVIPGITKKVALLQKLPETERGQYIDILAKYNAFYATYAFVRNMFNASGELTSRPPLFYDDGSAKDPQPAGALTAIMPAKKWIKKLTDHKKINNEIFQKAIDAGIKELSILSSGGKDVISQRALEKMFNELDKYIRERTLKQIVR